MSASASPEAADECVVVVGLGEVGRPLYELVSRRHRAVGVDVEMGRQLTGPIGVMHVCYPFEIDDFVGETACYIERFRPRVTIINSTVAVGTTRAVAERTGAAVVHSPTRGKHAHMLAELLSYTKFVGPLDPVTGALAAEHLASLGLRTRLASSPEVTELAKLTETTYFGLLIAWAQELERYCDRLGLDDDEVATFYDEIPFFPPIRYVPGVIGGHCVMPNIEILRSVDDSDLLRAIVASNGKKIERETRDVLGSPR
jgi:UDP-N-acetyl-D-mannosaminuronate dehydrogenase